MIPYVRKINLTDDNKRTKRKPPKLCPDCNESDNFNKLFSNKFNRIEEMVANIYNNLQKKKTENFSIYNEKFNLNNVPCEIEYDLKNFTLQELEKLGKFTIKNSNVDKYPSYTSPIKNENEEFTIDNVPNLPNFTLDELEESATQDFNDDNNHENENFILNNVPYNINDQYTLLKNNEFSDSDPQSFSEHRFHESLADYCKTDSNNDSVQSSLPISTVQEIQIPITPTQAQVSATQKIQNSSQYIKESKDFSNSIFKYFIKTRS
ncbi:4056_t:CDS:2 [Funneliformis mosseae]|uniref:4056_t:CDS:1 n=1 Tax=Funneliformis mosseae TaxID=27381 RepID=A0A9N8YRP2_FUNMO|nr:4056_t:CDS:2 [Funneliformis mosseae]